jgi:hypothetical protein
MEFDGIFPVVNLPLRKGGAHGRRNGYPRSTSEAVYQEVGLSRNESAELVDR